MGIVPDQVGGDQVMRDPFAFGGFRTAGSEDRLDELLEPVVGDDHLVAPLSCEQFVDDPPGNIRQPHVAAAVEICQEPMVEAQEVQDGGVQIVNVHLVLDRRVTEFVGGAVGLAPLDACAGHPGREPAGLWSRPLLF